MIDAEYSNYNLSPFLPSLSAPPSLIILHKLDDVWRKSQKPQWTYCVRDGVSISDSSKR